QVLRVLGAEPGGKGRRVVAAIALMALAALAPPAAAQTPSAEALYDAGALRAAADSFAARAAGEPRVPAHWYNLGATLYRAGADGKATAAWARADRLAPRDPLVRRARELLPAPDAASEALLTTGLATPGEWALGAGLCWVALWIAVAARRRRTVVLGLSLVTVAAAGLAAREVLRRAEPLAIVLNAATPVRVAPYGGASPASMVEAGAALLVDRRYGAWLEVHRADGVRGWVLAAEVCGRDGDDRGPAPPGRRSDRRRRGGRAARVGGEGADRERTRCRRQRDPHRHRGWREEPDSSQRRRRGHEPPRCGARAVAS